MLWALATVTVPETDIQNRHNNIILTCISLIPFIDYTLSYLILHIGVQYLPDIVRLPSAVRDKETIQVGIVYYVPCPVDGSLQCHYQIQLLIHGSLHQVYTRSGYGCIQSVAVLYLP